MTNREKVMVYALVIICILAGGAKLVIEPMYSKLTENSSKNEELLTQKEQLKLDKERLSLIDAALKNNSDKVIELEKVVSAYQEDEDVEEMIRELLEKHNLKTQVLEIDRDGTFEMPETVTAFTGKSISLAICGTKSNTEAFYKDIYNRQDIKIISFNGKYDEGTISSYATNFNTKVEGVYIIDFVVFMKNK